MEDIKEKIKKYQYIREDAEDTFEGSLYTIEEPSECDFMHGHTVGGTYVCRVDKETAELLIVHFKEKDAIIQELLDKLKEREGVAKALWELLDDIDTASDMFKPEQTQFYKYVMGKAEERAEYYTSDGYSLIPTPPKDK